MTIESLQRIFAERPDLAGRDGTRWLEMRSSAFQGNLIARNGAANIGGGMATPGYTNVNPLRLGTGGPTSGIPNHVVASFEQVDQIFQPGTVMKLISNRLPASQVNWARASRVAHRVIAPGGKIELNVWSHTEVETAEMLTQLRAAGFKNVRLGHSFPTATGPVEMPSPTSGSDVIISATR